MTSSVKILGLSNAERTVLRRRFSCSYVVSLLDRRCVIDIQTFHSCTSGAFLIELMIHDPLQIFPYKLALKHLLCLTLLFRSSLGPSMAFRLFSPLIQAKTTSSYYNRVLRRTTHQQTMVVSSSSNTNHQTLISVDPFCYRQFAEYEASNTYSGTVINISIEEFTKIVNERYQSSLRTNSEEVLLKEGYAPFCKHFFVRNDFTDARVNVLPITKENESLIRTKYEARNEREVYLQQIHFYSWFCSVINIAN